MKKLKIVALLMAMSLGLFACDEGENDVVDLSDAMAVDAVFRIPDADPSQDASPPVIMDAGSSDADSFLPDLNDCSDICDFYEQCDRIGLWVGGRDGCLDSCAAIENGRGFNAFVACLQTTPCGRLQECPIPAPPPPSCVEVCDGLDACGATARLPGALVEGDTCLAACDEESGPVHRDASRAVHDLV